MRTIIQLATLAYITCSLASLGKCQPSAGLGSMGSSAGGMEGMGEMPDPLQFELDGQAMRADRVRWFRVNVSTLQVENAPSNNGGMSGYPGGMGMDGGYGGEMNGSSGGMDMYGSSGGLDMYGGGGGMGGMPGAMGGGMGGMSMGGAGSMMGAGQLPSSVSNVNVAAFILDGAVTEGRAQVEVLISGTNNTWHRLDAEGIDAVLKHHLMLSGMRSGKKSKDGNPNTWTVDEGKLVTQIVRLKVWKDDTIKLLRSEAGKGAKSEAAEKLLKDLLTEDYEAQLKRQEIELARLQDRIQRIQEELARRHAAKERVVDVQLGKIMLEAQGILGNSDF